MPAQPVEFDPRRWWALPVILVGSFLSFLDFFIVNIALPAIRDDLGARPSQLQLVVAAYGIGFAVSLITGGRLGDIFGRKRVFLLGLGGFILASGLCSLATSPTMLIVSRVLQAVTAATLTPQVLAIIRVEFAPQERPFAIGLYGTSMGLASIVAQVLGGALVSMDLFGWSWRLIFLINIPIGLLAACLAAWVLRESRGATQTTLDLPGVCLISFGLFLLIYPLVEGREAGWPPWSFIMLTATVPVLYSFVCYERWMTGQGRLPLVALHLLRVPTIALGLAVSIVFFAGLWVFFVVLTVFFQTGLGYSAFSAGLMFLPFAIGFSVASAVSGPISGRIGIHIVNLGSLLMMFGLLGVIAWPQDTFITASIGPPLLVSLFLIYGLGQGLAQPALINAIVGSAGIGAADAGSAAGLFLTIAQSSIALGVAAIGNVFFSRLGTMPTQTDYTAALSAALSCNLVLQVATFLLVLLLPIVERRGPRSQPVRGYLLRPPALRVDTSASEKKQRPDGAREESL
jgi:EmrB/QacA subfamily drug resistance transporter